MRPECFMKLTENELRKLVREILRVRWRGDEYIVRGDIENQIEDNFRAPTVLLNRTW